MTRAPNGMALYLFGGSPNAAKNTIASPDVAYSKSVAGPGSGIGGRAASVTPKAAVTRLPVGAQDLRVHEIGACLGRESVRFRA